MQIHSPEETDFLRILGTNPCIITILDRAPRLGLAEWYLTAGAVFQTVWNHIDGRDPQSGIDDYDLFYFDDTDLSYEAEDDVIRRAAALFDDLDVRVEVRNEARVHLWYEDHFGVPATPFTDCKDAIDHFASTTCCYGIRRTHTGDDEIYAPHGFTDLFDMVLRPNPVLAPRKVYETKAARWQKEWPHLTVLPWPEE
ncbi:MULTISPECIES: nucleotidyltransferase family protein [Rhodococcus]|uniref:Nucleotidyltransferase family protein n=1 Tax=Rhodococcus pseudokoreensis TaxID=2811421 RepID=A0A974W9Z2_9NOCA|nr:MULTISPECIES: nucleotidyltransferase family protein [Rhodococcus]MBV6762554.1 nucleotidyltransferase family protein [Rhodococcus opacus]QSE94033.1 nucleotidyltransferase family protein [Rhodococcus pseudokoreensis]